MPVKMLVLAVSSLFLAAEATAVGLTGWQQVVDNFLGNLPTLLTALAGLFVAVYGAFKAHQAKQKADSIEAKVNGHQTALTDLNRNLTALGEQKDRTINDLIARAPVTAPVTVSSSGEVRETPAAAPAQTLDTAGHPITSGDAVIVTKDPK